MILLREYLDKCTMGELLDDYDRHECFTLELPWRNNQRGISCIPEGTYKCEAEGNVVPFLGGKVDIGAYEQTSGHPHTIGGGGRFNFFPTNPTFPSH